MNRATDLVLMFAKLSPAVATTTAILGAFLIVLVLFLRSDKCK